MKAARTLLIAIALIAPAAPAHAALIGLLGGNYDPPPINQGGTSGFVDCNAALGPDPNHPVDPRLTGYFCVFYNAFNTDPNFPEFDPFDGIFSLDFFLSFDDVPLQVGENQIGEYPYGVNIFLDRSPLSDLELLENSNQFDNALRLSGGPIVPFVATEGQFCDDFDDRCYPFQVNAVALILKPDAGEDVSRFTTRNLAVNNIPVPEPGTLLLLGPAAAALLIRRARGGRRRGRNAAPADTSRPA